MVSNNAEGAVNVAEGARYMRAVSFSFIPLALSGAIGSSCPRYWRAEGAAHRLPRRRRLRIR